MIVLNHICLPVLDLDRSLAFYRDALNLTPQRELWIHDHTCRLVFLGDGATDFRLELFQRMGRTKPYGLGEGSLHVGIRTDEFDALHAKHKTMGCIDEEDPTLGIYFLKDPDGHRIEIVPVRD